MKLLPKTNLKQKFATGLTLLIVFSVVGVATAQEVQRTYTVINPQIAKQLNPGETSEGVTSVVNETNAPLTFTLNVQDYIVQDTHGTPAILPPNTLNNKYSAASWIVVTPNKFTLKPQQKQDINYYIRVPQDGRPGGHYAAIVYTPTTFGQEPKTGTTIQTQIGSLFYITVNGNVTEQATVTKFMANPFSEYGPVKILTEIKNLGDLHIKPKGNITVSGLFGNWNYKLTEGNIFPQTARDLENTVGQWFMLGRYKAELAATYGTNNNLPLSASLYFWVFPWRLVLLIVLIIVATVLGYKYYKKRKKDNSKKTQEPKTVEPVTPTETPKKVG